MTLSLDTAYRSLGGEMKASTTPTICRLPDSRRHQLWAIAHHARAFGCPISRRSLAGEGDLLAPEARLVAKYCTGTALARQTVTRGDTHRFAFDREVKLPTAAGGVSGGHGSAPRLLIVAECRLDLRTTHQTQWGRARSPSASG